MLYKKLICLSLIGKNINICIIFIGKYLIVSIFEIFDHEIVDLLNPNAKYQLLVNKRLVPRVLGATGGLLGNSPIVCGGENKMAHGNLNVFQDCVVIGQPKMEIKMIEKRTFAASVALDQSTLWIVGGFNGCCKQYN